MNKLATVIACAGLSFWGAALSPASGVEMTASFVEPPRNDPPAEPTLTRYPGTIDFGSAQASGIERGQAVNGVAYTILMPLYYGAGNNNSYIRFFNAGTNTATFTATLVGSPSGTNYGSVNVTAAPHASPQYAIAAIFSTLGISGPSTADNGLSLYIQSPQGGRDVGFQHVIWNSQIGFFNNGSLCTYRSGVDNSFLNQTLVNVYTTQVPAYPSITYLHNYYSQSASYRLDAYKAATGAFVGSATLTIGANETVIINEADLERTLNYTPAPGEYNINIFYTAINPANFNGIAAQMINNTQLNALTNLSAGCGINP